MSVQQYANKFNELAKFAPNIVSNEKAKLYKFEDGLSFKIQIALGGIPSTTFEEAYARASNIARIQREEVVGKRKRDTGRSSQGSGFGKKPRVDNFQGGDNRFGNRGWDPISNKFNQQNQFKQDERCRRCNQIHPGRNCAGAAIHCFTCGGMGHRSYKCPIGQRRLNPNPNPGQPQQLQVKVRAGSQQSLDRVEEELGDTYM